MRDETQKLHVCPVCGGSKESLGLRDFKWLQDVLPGKVGGSDLDFVLEQSRTGRVLVIEFKPRHTSIPYGQRLLLTRMVNAGFDVWVVWEHDDGETVTVGAMTKHGRVPFTQSIHLARFRRLVGEWWTDGFRDSA